MVIFLSIIGIIISLWKIYTSETITKKIFISLIIVGFISRGISMFNPDILYFYLYVSSLSIGLILLFIDFFKKHTKSMGIVLLVYIVFLINYYAILLEFPYRYEIFILRLLLIFLPILYFILFLRKNSKVKTELILILILFLIEIIVKYRLNWFPDFLYS